MPLDPVGRNSMGGLAHKKSFYETLYQAYEARLAQRITSIGHDGLLKATKSLHFLALAGKKTIYRTIN